MNESDFTPEEIQKAKNRIAKMMRMSKDVSSPKEAANAAAMARKLMDKFQLEEADIMVDTTRDVFGTGAATGDFPTIPRYMSILAVAVAKYNDCIARFVNSSEGPHKSHVEFAGYTSDVELGTVMYKWLLKTIGNLAKEHCKIVIPHVDSKDMEYIRVSNMFKLGAGEAICATFRTITAERDSLTSKTGTALVVRKMGAVTKHFGDVKYSTARTRTLSRAESTAKSAGWIKGSQVKLTTDLQ
jgi:hypothetical protein